jgi:glycosyltransferase involved in cell wall biosynthesis
MPLISVLTAAHGDRADFLVEAGESLAAQQLPAGWELEWIVQEDGEKPQLADAIAGFDFVKHSAHGEAAGAAATRNLALARVSGEFVHVLDSDDLLLPNGLAASIEAFRTRPWLHWVCGQADDLMPDGTRVPVSAMLPPGVIEPGMVSDHMAAYEIPPVHPAGMTLRTSLTRAVGGWAGIPRAEDNSLLIAVTELSFGYLTPEVTWLYRKHDGQITTGPTYTDLVPASLLVVRQRIAALRETGLQFPPPPPDEKMVG